MTRVRAYQHSLSCYTPNWSGRKRHEQKLFFCEGGETIPEGGVQPFHHRKGKLRPMLCEEIDVGVPDTQKQFPTSGTIQEPTSTLAFPYLAKFVMVHALEKVTGSDLVPSRMWRCSPVPDHPGSRGEGNRLETNLICVSVSGNGSPGTHRRSTNSHRSFSLCPPRGCVTAPGVHCFRVVSGGPLGKGDGLDQQRQRTPTHLMPCIRVMKIHAKCNCTDKNSFSGVSK